ncbi:hypothetical protein ET445_14735 [Agromyces protaetiae]|uniref:Uncharacterized protein n=1 Tax=Agromyces protaetiae TaxID=2509455 RepID=A0A4P6FEN4_9MICO|nr:hypothetical protein [Agromyces protaetiae]QAY74394.1 hypothetical protein ET445_14735 [Agromyces protaetiae]
MDDLAGAGGDVAPEDDFTVVQDTEFDELDVPEDDDARPIDDSLVDDLPGIDAERRVDLSDDRARAAEPLE